jgi:hypothetical protein
VNPKGTFHDAITGETIERELTEEEYAALIESGWTENPEETSGERSASDNVEEEGSPNDPIPDSGSAPSPS